MNNKIWGIILGIVVILGLIWWYQGSESELTENQGALYVGITDATAEIENINEVSMEVEKVEIYSETKGWGTVSEDRKTYNLFDLKANSRTELYAKSDVDAGAYARVRVTLGDTIVRTKANGDMEAYMPSRQVVMNMHINVVAQKDTYVELDFLADQSLHSTSEGKYFFAPVVNAQAESNTTVTVGENSAITSVGGTMDSSVSVGVGIDGASRNNYSLTTDSDFSIDDSTPGSIKFMLGGQTYTESTTVQEEPIDINLDTDLDIDTNLDLEVNGSEEDSNGNTSGSVDLDGELDVNL